MNDTPHPFTREELVEIITATTHEVMSIMLGMEVAAVPAAEHGPPAPAVSGAGAVALVGLAGNWAGTGSIACTGEFACTLASNLLGAAYESVDEEVLDAVGEIANMIIGNVKTPLETRLGRMGLSVPTVIFGRNFQTRTARVRDWTVVAFEHGSEKMFVQLSLAQNQFAMRETPRGGFEMPHLVTL